MDNLCSLWGTLKPRHRTFLWLIKQVFEKIDCSKLNSISVYSPRLNEIIDATKERHIYQIKLKDSLLSNLNFVKVGQKEIEVAWIRGRIDYLR